LIDRVRAGPLGQREFRLLFLGRTTSLVGTAFANVALAFAVLDLTGSKADLGYVLAARSLPQVLFLLVGGIWADRLPRHKVMVASNLASGISQGAIAALLLAGQAEVWQLMALGAVNGLSSAFFFPAAIGIVPQTVPQRMLQSANAVLRLGNNASWIGGAAVGGLVVAATSPGVAIAFDSATFFLAAVFLALMQIPASLRMEASNFLAELAVGWREFISRAWLWSIVLQFGFVNAIQLGTESVLGPAIAKDHLGGAAPWGFILTAQSLGLVAGGLIMLRLRPRRLLLAATLGYLLTIPFLLRAGGPDDRRSAHRTGGPRGNRLRDVWDPLGHDDAAGDPAGEALAGLVLRRARLVRPDPVGARRGRPGRAGDRHASDDPHSGRDQPDRDPGRPLRQRRADDQSSGGVRSLARRP
jgi:MFS family permease